MKTRIKITQILEKTTKEGNQYFIIQDNGAKYYVWDPKLLVGLNPGDVVSIVHTEGQFPKVTKIEKLYSEIKVEKEPPLEIFETIEKGKEQKLKLITIPETSQEERTELVQEFEIRDERELEKEIMGETLLDYFYQFQIRGRTVTGLSIAGLREIARRMGNIKVSEPKIEDKGDRWICKTEVKDLLRNVTAWGVSQQLKNMKLKDGSELEDDFALQKCYSKSLRNALRSLIPERLVSHMLQKFMEEKEKFGTKRNYYAHE